jgi:hypothetical protein
MEENKGQLSIKVKSFKTVQEVRKKVYLLKRYIYALEKKQFKLVL